MTVPSGALVLLTGLLAACGSGAAVGGYGPARAASSAPPTASSAPPTPTNVLSPGPSPSVVSSAAPTLASAPPPPPPPMAHVTSQAFLLVPIGDARARGSVTVTTQSGHAAISVVVSGLAAGSVHSVHLHFGNCPSAGSHILVLGTLRADAAGSGEVTSTVNAAFTGPGHFVIVYVGPAAGPLGACANLG